jgi:hypothetical protein
MDAHFFRQIAVEARSLKEEAQASQELGHPGHGFPSLP